MRPRLHYIDVWLQGMKDAVADPAVSGGWRLQEIQLSLEAVEEALGEASRALQAAENDRSNPELFNFAQKQMAELEADFSAAKDMIPPFSASNDNER